MRHACHTRPLHPIAFRVVAEQAGFVREAGDLQLCSLQAASVALFGVATKACLMFHASTYGDGN